MALKRRIENQAEIPAGLGGAYVEREGVWHLDAEEDPRVGEMRSTNTGLNKKLAELEKRFAGIEPEAVRALAAEKARLEEEQRLKEGKYQEVLAEKIKAALAPVAAERDAASARLAALLIDNAVVAEATKLGLRPTAIPDLTARARQIFRLEGEAPKAFQAGTNEPLAGRDGVSPMTLAEWVGNLGAEAPHLFEANAGGGAAGSGSGGAAKHGGVANPWGTGTRNVTEQMRLLRENPGLAARLQAAAN